MEELAQNIDLIMGLVILSFCFQILMLFFMLDKFNQTGRVLKIILERTEGRLGELQQDVTRILYSDDTTDKNE